MVIFIAGLGLVLSVLFLLSNHLTIYHSRVEQKNIFASKVGSRLSNVIANEYKRIATLGYDWAAWDAMYGYAEKPFREFEADSLPPNVVPESDLSLVLIMNKNQQVIYHQGFNQESGRFVKFELLNPAAAPLWQGVLRSFSQTELIQFIAITEFGPLVTISAPILHSDGKGPMNGRVVMGRLIEQSFQQRVGATIQENTTLLTPARLQKELAQNELLSLFKNDFFYKESKNFLSVYRLFRDSARQAAFSIRIDADKTMFHIQEKAMRNFLIALLFCTLLAGAISYVFIDRMLLRRLKHISKKAKHITTFEDLSIRIHEDRHDEIAQLGHDINKMLERLGNENIRRQGMEQRLILNEKLVATGRLAANIAHEVNNPLFAISNSIAVIKGQIKNPSSDIREVLSLAEKEIKRVRKITRKLLDYGKINLETFKESEIDSILDTTCAVLKLSKQIKNTAIVRNKKCRETPIVCNPDSLQQVFMNLILNASEAMSGQGEIAIDVVGTGAIYNIHFRDNGPGFPVSVKKRIFEPFNSSKDAKGAGLGLYISYHIVKRHGGSMILKEEDSSGSHWIITLPRGGGAIHE